MPKGKLVPTKVLWYFPPIAKLQKMFQSVETTKSLTWHATEREVDNKFHHPTNSLVWKMVDEKWVEFGASPRNLQLSLSTNSVNPHGSLSIKYSCWLVMLVTYNLSPLLYMKQKYTTLVMLISGPRQLEITLMYF